ncbi:MAG: hypothetical protein C5B51_12970 [Terriglobia bacterium]|nr:MAG: hypothetical protein C5B51_12970 [Terriglobia bacterium]
MRRRSFFVWMLLVAAAIPSIAPAKTVYRVETVAGSGGMGDGGPATAAQIGQIQGVAADRFGNIYLSDTDNHRVRKVSASGIITVLAGTGSAGFSGDGGPAAGAALNYPYGLAVDLAGNVYVADLGNFRVRRIGLDGIINTEAGNGKKGSAGDGGPALNAPLMTPRNLAVDAGGNLFIAEFDGHRVRKVTPDGKMSTVAGTGVAGFRGDGGLATGAQLGYPAGLAVDRYGAIYIADSQNQRIRKVGPGGTIVTVLGGSAATTLLTPTSLALDTAGTIYVADRSDIVRAYTASGTWSNVAGTGIAGFSGDGGPASAAKLAAAHDLAVDTVGNLYIADGLRIRKVNNNGIIQTTAGDGYLRAIGDGGIATAAILFRPSAVALDPLGNLLIADTGTHRIRRVNATGQITTLSGTGVAGFSGDGLPAAGAPLNTPRGVAIDSLGNVIAADTGNERVRQIANDGRIQTLIGTGAGGMGEEGLSGTLTVLHSPQGACVNRIGTIYVVDSSNHRVLRAAPGAAVVTAAGNGSPGDAGDGGLGRLAQLNQPAACAFDTAGNLFVADTFNHRIRKVTAAGIISTVAGAGNEGYTGDGGAATEALLRAPRGVAVDDDGNIYISDTGNNRIRQVTRDGLIRTIAGGEGASVPLSAPGGLARDGSGTLYVADTGNNVVRRLIPEQVQDPPAVTLLPELSAVNSASVLPGPVAPGEALTIFGSGLGPESGVAGGPDAAGLLSNLVAGTEVRFDGVPAPVFYAQAGQINVQVPYTIAGSAVTHLEARYNGQLSGTLALPVADAAPGLFPVIVNPDGSPNSAAEPALRGTVVTLYGTGEGLTDGANLSGKAATAPFSRPRLPAALTIAGVNAEVLYAGSAPGLVGTLQINARVPGGFVPEGPQIVYLIVGTTTSAPITIWLK